MELIITTTLLGFILLILFNIYPNSVTAIKHGEHRIKAATIAQSMLEQKRAGVFSDIYNPPDQSLLSPEDRGAYSVSYECYNIPDTEPGRIKRIRVVVSWSERNGRYSVYKECYVSVVHP